METRWLETFVAVADRRGFAAAAAELGVSQPTVSAQIAALEKEFGVALFDRDRRPIGLTDRGRALLVHAHAILGEIESARGNVSESIGRRRGDVRLGTYPSATAGYIPELLKAFRAVYPLIRVRLVELGGAHLHDAAARGDVQLFLRQTTPPLSETVFRSHPMWREKFKVLTPAYHPLARSDEPLAPAQLLKHPLIMTGRYDTDSLQTHPLWFSLRQPPPLAYQVSNPQSLVALVSAGLGVGVTTQLAMDVSRTDNLHVRDIDHPDAVRDVRVWWPRQRRLPLPAQTLLQFMTDTAGVPYNTLDTRKEPRPV
ncbi:DNA-binding transcriptional regulator, LysR family [Micromonospora pallida]|uniref:DNA-binding transcriptional regulator, LysR family n=1 Tax=Micromonospora pallida TaxID=145854 RepID=A0A1C6SHY3_9ACTN|nr:LysR family transcriptional regulator [Micromonospora pallida]SCL28849.1 DNA-binding transcriptional regulator, LysR family [Micromonospora pallida]